MGILGRSKKAIIKKMKRIYKVNWEILKDLMHQIKNITILEFGYEKGKKISKLGLKKLLKI